MDRRPKCLTPLRVLLYLMDTVTGKTTKASTKGFEQDTARAKGGARIAPNTVAGAAREELPILKISELGVKYLPTMESKTTGRKNMNHYGDGGVFRRGQTWWIRYSHNGKPIRESANTTDERKAHKRLRQRIEEIKKPFFVGPSEKKLTMDDLKKKLEADYIRNDKRSLDSVKFCLKPVKAFFEFDRLLEITSRRIEAYQQHRLDRGMARATINRELAYLRRGFRLLFEAREISFIPVIKLLGGENVREGFINRPEFDGLSEHLDQDNRDIVTFLYLSAWRSGEAMSLTWEKVDLTDWVIRLSRKNEKTKRPRTLALVGELREIIERRQEKRTAFCPFVFHRKGRQIKSFLNQFRSAAIAVGLGQMTVDPMTKKSRYLGIVPHDLRRSGIRNLTKAGVGESEGMSISGHRTNSTYKRYNIIDEDLQRQALEKAQQFQKLEVERRKVVPIRKVG